MTASTRTLRGVGAFLAVLALVSGPLPAQAQDEGETPRAVPLAILHLGRDTLVARPGVRYEAGPVHRFFFGSLHRPLWDIEFPVPVLDLDTVGGGLTLTELSGGKQTLGSRFDAANGLIYQFRSIVKDASRAIPGPLQSTPVDDVFQDQMAAQFPLGAMVVAHLLQSAGVLVAAPTPVIMPDDPRLGEHREILAGRMGWIEVRPNEREGDRPGFAGSSKITGTDELYEELRENPASYVNLEEFLRARLVDFMVGDWDRHQGQWRWASFAEGERIRWDPIPRDRDWAFSKIDGFFTLLTAIYFPKYVGFSDQPPDVDRMAFSAQLMDRRLLTGLDREEFAAVAADLQSRLTNAALDSAVAVLPAPYREAGATLIAGLRTRRDALPETAMQYYARLSDQVDLYGTEGADQARFERIDDERVRVEIHSGGHPVVKRTFVAGETREIRVYLTDGDDEAEFDGSGDWPIDVRVIGGDGDDRFVDRSDGAGLRVYDDDGDNTVELGSAAFFEDREYNDLDKMEERPRPVVSWDWRDWGSVWVPRPEVRYQSDIGLFVGAGISRYGWGFRKVPYESRISLALLTGLRFGKSIGDLEIAAPLNERGMLGRVNAEWHTQTPVRFFGLGNQTEPAASEEFNETIRSGVLVDVLLEHSPDSTLTLFAGPSFSAQGAVDREGTIFETMPVYGSLNFQQLGLRGGVRFDTRDDARKPSRGVDLDVDLRGFPEILDVADAFGGARARARAYLSADLPLRPVLHLRAIGEKVVGTPPLAELAYLGGSGSLPGFERERFAGDGAVSGSALLRVRLGQVNLLTDLGVGLLGLASTGRVWLDGASPGGWHTAWGGGVWLDVVRLERAVSVTFADGGDGLQFYVDFGFLY